MIFDHDSISSYLDSELRKRIESNPRFSLRAFANNLQMSPGSLSDIIAGHRGLGPKVIPRMAKALSLQKDEVDHLIFLANKKNSQNIEKSIAKVIQPKSEKTLYEDVFSLISEWYHFAILNLFDLDEFNWDAKWIARRLNITRLQAKSSMSLLVKLGIVRKKSGKVIVDESHLQAISDHPSDAIRSYHMQILDKAKESIDSQKRTEREISGIGFAVDRNRIPDLKKEMDKFQNKIISKYSCGKKNEIYFLELALFKLTNGETNE